jgi:autotransporter-associated beta strand protein
MKLSSKLALFFACFGMSGLSYAQTSYTDVSVTTAWNDLRWNNSEDAEPYDSAFTADNDVIFTSGAYLFAGMGETIDLGNISLNSGVSVNFTASSGLLSTGGEISTLDIGSGSLLDFGSQAFTTAEAGMGFIKNGAGVLALTGGSYAGGLTLNAGTIIARGTSALGSGSLTLNGGTIAATANTTFSSAQLPGGITIGGNVQFGELSTNVALASNTATLSFGSAVNLGSGNRTFTLGNNGVQTFSGVISNTSGGITFAANAGTTGRFDITNIANTFTGDITITGGQARFSRDASLGNANNDVIIDGGVFSNSTTAITLGTGRSISLGDGAGSAINTQANITVQTGITDKSGETGALVKTGTGTLFLNGNNTYTGNTTISAGNLQINGTGRLGAGAYAGNISIAASRSFIFASTASQTLSGQISGAGNFTVNLGTVKLTGTNSLTGTYTVGNGGVLDLVNNGALNGATSLVLSSGAVLDNSSSGAIALANNSMTKTITGLLNYYGTGGQSLSLGNGLTTISGNTTFNIDEGTLVFGSNLNASGISLTKDGTGVLQFNGLQTGRLAGTNTVSAGTLRIVSDNSLGSGIIIDVQDDATLSLDGNLSWTGS